MIRIMVGDCLERLKELPDDSVDSVVTDPPYHLTSIVKRFGAGNAAPAQVGATGAYARASRGFMGQTWDGGDIAFRPETWAEVMRVLKPGGHLVAFSGTRTYHRMAVAIEDAGFEIRDMIGWLYGSGFPKSHNVPKSIDATITLGGSSTKQMRQRDMGDSYRPHPKSGTAGFGDGNLHKGADGDRRPEDAAALATQQAEQWQGWGTALKPAQEPICLARKPLIGTIAANVLAHGTGALNIDGCRIETEENRARPERSPSVILGGGKGPNLTASENNLLGRWPANIVHDGSPEVLAAFPETASGTGAVKRASAAGTQGNALGVESRPAGTAMICHGDSGSAARFFYTAKTASSERHAGCEDMEKGNAHPTVKPVDLMRWLVRLVTPPGGTVLDPFMGSGSTMIAADAEQFNGIGCELSPEYAAIAERRIRQSGGMFAEVTVS